MVWIETDGLVRMTVQELLDVRFQHLCSGMNACRGDPIEACGTTSEWAGYTEWASEESPRITLGWDWRLHCACDSVVLTQDGAARTNVMLVDADRRDVGWLKNLKALSMLVRSVDWAEPVQKALAERYC